MHTNLCFDRDFNGIGDVKFLKCDYLLLQRWLKLTLAYVTVIYGTQTDIAWLD